MRQLLLVGNSNALYKAQYEFLLNSKAKLTVLSNTRIKITFGEDDWILIVVFQTHWRNYERLLGFNFDCIQMHDSFYPSDEFVKFAKAQLLR